MVGRHHVISNAAMTASLVCGVIKTYDGHTFASPLLFSGTVLELVLCVCLCLFGALIPDADTKTSALGRFIKLPGRHRTWTHAIWMPFLLCVIGWIFFKPLVWLGFGWFFHVFVDSLSRAGVCWLWPFMDYVRYSSGAFVARGHWLKLYKTGERSVSEKVVLGVIVVFCGIVSVCICLF